MTTTPTELSRSARHQDPPAPPTSTLVPPPKRRRPRLVIAASVAAICLGALASVWAYTTTSTAHSVLAVRQTVHRGETITRQHLMTVQIGVDPALRPLSANEIGSVVGKRASMDMPAGGVVVQEQITSDALPAKGSSVVGISLAAALLPADAIKVGDRVRIVTTPGASGEITAEKPNAIDATVVGITKDSTSGNTIVNVQVPYDDAPDVAARAATGKVAVVLDSSER